MRDIDDIVHEIVKITLLRFGYQWLSPGQNGPILVHDIFRCFVAPGRFWTNYGIIGAGRGI